MAKAALGPMPAAATACARGSTTLPAAQTPATLVQPVRSVTTQPALSLSHPSRLSNSSCGTGHGKKKAAYRRRCCSCRSSFRPWEQPPAAIVRARH